jgi:hypothetical protein
MKAVTDTKLVEQGKRFGRIASFAGLGVLVLGLVISFRFSNLILLAYGCLIVGFILSNIGIYLANRWVREPRADQSLSKALKGFDNQFSLYNYTLPAQHVLLMPSGVAHFVVKPQNGDISVNGSRWRHKFNAGRLLRFFVEEGLGNPSQDAQQEAAELMKFVRKSIPNGDIPLSTFIVFTAPDDKLRLTINSPTVPVLPLRDLKERLRKLSKGKAMPAELQNRLADAFNAVAPAQSA